MKYIYLSPSGLKTGESSIPATLHISSYTIPYSDPPRLMVQLKACKEEVRLPAAEEEEAGRLLRPPPTTSSSSLVISVNLPAMPPPPHRQFYAKAWGENEGLLEQLVAQGEQYPPPNRHSKGMYGFWIDSTSYL